MNRQTFLKNSLLATGAVIMSPVSYAQSVTVDTGRGPGKGPRNDLREVYEFVQAAHRDLPKVREMLQANPSLANARWDWGEGDWESGLEGASHMGQREIVRFLLDQGARGDVFAAAMLGQTHAVEGFMAMTTATAESRGPHGLPLMFYVGHGGKVAMAETVLPHVVDRGGQCNSAIHTATLSNHVDLVTWLIGHGVTDINTPNFFDKTPLDAATERGFTELAQVLRQHGGVSSK